MLTNKTYKMSKICSEMCAAPSTLIKVYSSETSSNLTKPLECFYTLSD